VYGVLLASGLPLLVVGDPRWKAYLTFDSEVVIYCPECAEREFGRDPSTPLNGSAEA